MDCCGGNSSIGSSFLSSRRARPSLEGPPSFILETTLVSYRRIELGPFANGIVHCERCSHPRTGLQLSLRSPTCQNDIRFSRSVATPNFVSIFIHVQHFETGLIGCNSQHCAIALHTRLIPGHETLSRYPIREVPFSSRESKRAAFIGLALKIYGLITDRGTLSTSNWLIVPSGASAVDQAFPVATLKRPKDMIFRIKEPTGLTAWRVRSTHQRIPH